MASAQLICQIRVRKANSVFALKDCSDVRIETRTKWAHEVIKYFGGSHERIRPWNLLARLDGSVESLALPASRGEVYPARFQIPPGSLHELDRDAKVKRTEMFAMASLLYEIMSGRQPFEGLTDDEVQNRFSNGDFPSDAASLPNSLSIYSGWSEKFSQELTGLSMKIPRRSPKNN